MIGHLAVGEVEIAFRAVIADCKWASSRENLSLGFPTKRVSKQSTELQGLARKLNFHL